MIEGVYFTVLYSPVTGIYPLHIIIAIASAEGLVIFVSYISNSFYDKILPNPAEIFYLSLPYLNMDWYKSKVAKTSIRLNI